MPNISRLTPRPRSIQKPAPQDPHILGYHNCGSGQDYGICKACGKGHGFKIRIKPL